MNYDRLTRAPESSATVFDPGFPVEPPAEVQVLIAESGVRHIHGGDQFSYRVRLVARASGPDRTERAELPGTEEPALLPGPVASLGQLAGARSDRGEGSLQAGEDRSA